MIKLLIATSLALLILFISSCGNEENVVFILDNGTSKAIGYFKPDKSSVKTNILSAQSKEPIGYFDRKKPGSKTYIIRNDGGDVLYFTESYQKGNIIYIFNPKSDIWGYFYQY